MKAILVIDAPKNCGECPCCYGFICSPLVREMGMWAIHNGKPTDCPLKPMPYKSVWDNDFSDGWNACLEALEDSHNGESSNDESNTCVEVISNDSN